METKQVIVIRKDLKMRRGKEIAQGAHAAMAWLRERLLGAGPDFTTAERDWLTGSYAKVVCQVDSLEALIEVEAAALDAGLEVHVVTDAGRTEFHGEFTTTCLAIGPDEADKIDKVTGHLPLY